MINDTEYYESFKDILIKPKFIMFKYRKYNIISCHKGYEIKKYYIIVNNKKDKIIQNIIISDCCHPNAFGGENKQLDLNKPPKFSKFCLSDNVKGSKLISNSLMKKYVNDVSIWPNYMFYSNSYIRYMLMYWSLDNPHHYPIKEHVKTNPPLPKELL